MILVIDVETTGFDPELDAVVDLAAVPLYSPKWEIGMPWHSLVDPCREVPPQALAVHHLTNAVLRWSPVLADAFDEMTMIMRESSGFAAHNAVFDKGFLAQMDWPHMHASQWICTYRCACFLWPDAPAHSNQVLRHWVPTVEERVDELLERHCPGLPDHRALPDALTTAVILQRMLRIHSAEQLQQISALPLLLPRVTFGKHRGTPWREVPRDYLQWVLGRDPPFDPDTVRTARHWLNGGSGA